MIARQLDSTQYPTKYKELVMTKFKDIPMSEWLTARQIADMLSDTSYTRTVEVLRDIRSLHPEQYKLIGRSYLYHPAFVELVDSRDKTPGVKPKTEKTNNE